MNALPKLVLAITASILLTADAYAGRWLSRDPIQDGAGFVQREVNPYAFVLNDSINYFDAFGLDIWVGHNQGDVSFHLNINVGNPNGNFQSWSFGVGGDNPLLSSFEALTPFFNNGVVYKSTPSSGKTDSIDFNRYLVTTASEDAQATQILDSIVGEQSSYWLLSNKTCRKFSKELFDLLHDDYHIGILTDMPAWRQQQLSRGQDELNRLRRSVGPGFNAPM